MRFFRKFECENCHQRFSQQEELMQHQEVVHNKDLPYDCKKCNEFFFKYGRNANSFTKKTQLQKG